VNTALLLINALLVLISTLHMLYHRRPAQSLIVWMLTLFLLPFLGVLLYFIFGSRKVLYRRAKPYIHLHPVAESTPSTPLARQTAQLIEGNNLPRPSQNNRVEPIADPQEAFLAFSQAIQQAQHNIYLETYIFEMDVTGTALLEQLKAKAQQGVSVRLLIDAFGAMPLYLNPKKLKPYRQAGIEIAFFHPLATFLQKRLNLRTHRKIYLIDEQTVFTGGMNLSKDYLLPPDAAVSQQNSWVDLFFKMEGEVCQHYLEVFKEDWQYTTGKALPNQNFEKTLPAKANTLLQAVPSGPDVENDALLEALLQAFYQAQRRITLVTPYLIPSHNILDALQVALKKGVQVTLLTPAKTDHLIFDWGRSSYMRELHDLGAEIYCYGKTMLHAKLVIIDDEVMMLGSANLDYRSLLVNYEMVSFCYSEPLMQTMQEWVDDLQSQSEIYRPKQDRTTLLLENLSRIVTPLL
jgi:cardiolipin synthase